MRLVVEAEVLAATLLAAPSVVTFREGGIVAVWPVTLAEVLWVSIDHDDRGGTCRIHGVSMRLDTLGDWHALTDVMIHLLWLLWIRLLLVGDWSVVSLFVGHIAISSIYSINYYSL